MPKIAIIGAGVVGLSTAVCVQEEILNAKVTVIADRFLQDTTSFVAPGLFRPSWNEGSSQATIARQYAKDSYYRYWSILHSADSSEAGIFEVSGYQLTNKKDLLQNELLQNIVPWRQITDEELEKFPGHWKYGSFYTTLIVECHRYLPWLTKKIVENGGEILERKIECFEELVGQYDVVINCAGLGAKLLANDSWLSPIQGQIIQVKAPWIKHFYFVDLDTYIIPGVDHVSLGGTRNFDCYNEDVDRHTIDSIWERCCSVLPSLNGAEILKEKAGLRPYRPLLRLEHQLLTFANAKLNVVHNYGHGGHGVTFSWGTARAATKIAENVLSASLHSKL